MATNETPPCRLSRIKGGTQYDSCSERNAVRVHFLSSVQPNSRLTIERTGLPLAHRLEIAGDSESRTKGLLGRDHLPVDQAIVIAPSQGVHTFGMRFPIDIVAVDRRGCVVKIRSNVVPNRIVMAWSAFAILELTAGSVDRAQVIVGDRLLAQP